MKAISIDKASNKIRIAIERAKLEIQNSEDSELKSLRGSELVLKKIQAYGNDTPKALELYDPKNPADMIILTMASWE
jgi:hypothetical protein